MSDYTVIYEQSDDGSWGASVPDLDVHVGGETREEVEESVRVGVRFHLAGLVEQGRDVPRPRVSAGTVSARPAQASGHFLLGTQIIGGLIASTTGPGLGDTTIEKLERYVLADPARDAGVAVSKVVVIDADGTVRDVTDDAGNPVVFELE